MMNRIRRQFVGGALGVGLFYPAQSHGTSQMNMGVLNGNDTRYREREIGGDAFLRLSEFGQLGDKSNGDNDVFERCMAYVKSASGGQAAIVLPRGAIYLARPISLERGVCLIGAGPNFSSQLVPLASFNGCSVIQVTGANVPGGWAFRCHISGVCINCRLLSNDAVRAAISIENAYSVRVRDSFIYHAPVDGIAVRDCNDVGIGDCHIFGRGRRNGGSGVRGENCNLLTLQSINVEDFQAGVTLGRRAITVAFAPFIERCTKAVEVDGQSCIVSMFGGQLLIRGHGGRGLVLRKGRGHFSGLLIDRRHGGHAVAIQGNAEPGSWEFTHCAEWDSSSGDLVPLRTIASAAN